MVGVKLRSGKLSDYVATGAEGAPAYAAADQLRVAIRKHIGQESADFFAIAKPNDTGDSIEWYAPNRGTVIPWSTATPEEKTEAKEKLVEAQSKILEHSATLLKSENPEQQLFGKLLEKSVRIPDDTHVYIVNGKPVVTFWGFDKPNAPSGVDTIKTLVTVPNLASQNAGEEIIPPPPEEKKRSFWTWLLPLLLLLLLLLVLLYACTKEEPQSVLPAPTPQHNNSALNDDTKTVLDEDKDEQAIIDDERDINDVDRINRINHHNSDVNYTGDYDVNRSRDVDVDSTYDNTLDQDTDVTQDTELLEDTDSTLDANGIEGLDGIDEDAGEVEQELMDDEGIPVDSDLLEEDVPLPENLDALGEDGQPIPPEAMGEEMPAEDAMGENTPMDSPVNDPSLQNPAMDENAMPPSPQQSQQQQRNNARPQPLTIPPEAMRNGSTEFMDGQWSSHAGLIDSETGKPVKVEYDIKDGEGQARIKRPDGSVCSGNVGTKMEGGQLVIAGENSIRCPDGVTYDTSKVVCTNDDNGGTSCKGMNNSGGDYPVRLRKSQ